MLEKMIKEVNPLLSCGCVELHGSNTGHKVTAPDAFAYAVPPSCLLFLEEWLGADSDKVRAPTAEIDNTF